MWNIIGIEGSFLNNFLETPLFIHSITIEVENPSPTNLNIIKRGITPKGRESFFLGDAKGEDWHEP